MFPSTISLSRVTKQKIDQESRVRRACFSVEANTAPSVEAVDTTSVHVSPAHLPSLPFEPPTPSWRPAVRGQREATSWTGSGEGGRHTTRRSPLSRTRQAGRVRDPAVCSCVTSVFKIWQIASHGYYVNDRRAVFVNSEIRAH